jgi:O-antigen ligase
VVVGWDSLMTFKRDKDLDAELTAESAKLRPVLATVAWHMFQDRPLLGFGFGQYKEVMPDYLADRTTDLPLEKARPFVQHNVFLALLTDLGLVGLGLFVAVLAGWTWYGWQLWYANDGQHAAVLSGRYDRGPGAVEPSRGESQRRTRPGLECNSQPFAGNSVA